MSVILNNLANNVIGLTLASAYTAGGGSMTLSSGGSLLPTTPFRMTVVTAATYQTSSEALTIYEVTGVSGNVLTLASNGAGGAIEGTTDRNYAVGDKVDLRLTAGAITDLNTAVAPAVTTGITATGSNQSGAAALSAPSYFGSPSYQVVTSVLTGANGVALPSLSTSPSNVGMQIAVTNAGVSPLLVYPANGSSNTINGGAANAPAVIPSGGTQTFCAASGTAWYTKGTGFPNIQVFTTVGGNSWTMPPLANVVRVLMIGGGGGGGGGGLQTSGATLGGGGGGGGAYCDAVFRAIDLPSTVTVTVGAGGNGGAGSTTNGATGASGSAGANTTFGAYAEARGGSGGGGGGAGTGGGGGSLAVGLASGGAGGSSLSTGNPSAPAASQFSGSGGGGGGGQNSGGTLYNGAGSGATFSYYTNGTGSSGGAANSGGIGTAGSGGGVTCSIANTPSGGIGGGGGGAGSGGGGNGGNGGTYGGGGGGGGMGQSVSGGTGGNGGQGVCVVITM